jgi:UTP--glucose-1-phosphate uridylyltransferase
VKIRKAVIPAAGLGTRMLPASSAFPKELLPIGVYPALHYVLCEAARSGIETVVLVNAAWKSALDNYLALDEAWIESMTRQGHELRLAPLLALRDRIEIVSVRQRGSKGLGHAVASAMPVIGDDPFAVLLPDELILQSPDALQQLLAHAEDSSEGAVAVLEVPPAEVQRYGIVSFRGELPARLDDLVEKPAPAEAPSRYAVVGRYAFPRGFRAALADLAPGAGGELQLTDAMRSHLDRFPLTGIPVHGERHDTGNIEGYARAWQAWLDHPERFESAAWPEPRP